MKKRIEKKVSKTAEYTCTLRAFSYGEKNCFYKSDDYAAIKIIPLFIKTKIIKFLIKQFFSPKGMYEYIISRTKYIDNIFTNTLNDVEQILIFGAGFDSRSIRFKEILKNKTIFEIDSPITQTAKIEQFKKRNLDFPNNHKFIPLDFEKESLSKKLQESGFQKNKKSLFLLEGLTMYLDSESVQNTFNVIKEFSGSNSLLVFDYVYLSVIRNENQYNAEKKIVKTVTKAGEKWKFGIEKGQIDDFLKKFNFQLIDESDSKELEKNFFTDNCGKRIGHVNETHCLVTAHTS